MVLDDIYAVKYIDQIIVITWQVDLIILHVNIVICQEKNESGIGFSYRVFDVVPDIFKLLLVEKIIPHCFPKTQNQRFDISRVWIQRLYDVVEDFLLNLFIFHWFVNW